MDILQKLTEELEVKKWQVEAAVGLIDEGNTIPFISRYRKEVTGALNDEQLRKLDERLTYLRNLEDKKAQVLASIEEQGKLTEELRAQIEAAQTQVEVDDLYRPYRPKRRTRATMAKEKGLEGLANVILLQMTKKPLEEEAAAYRRKGCIDCGGGPGRSKGYPGRKYIRRCRLSNIYSRNYHKGRADYFRSEGRDTGVCI